MPDKSAPNPRRKAAPRQREKLPAGAPVRGSVTGIPLRDVRRLCLPPVTGAFGHNRPPLDDTALRLSLELAYMTYSLDLDPWMRAGWTDISIQVDNRLQGGVTVGESESVRSERFHALLNTWKLARARMALKEINPVSQIMGAFRQREKSDTIKAVTMLHPAADGRYVVAIGFMGTGSRFYDWFSNFRITAERGFHKGFQQLTQYFEQSVEHINFPETAAALSLPSLSLRDILLEMCTPHSRFTLWMAGHSQGAAVMQIFCHHLLHGWGVLPRHMVGYGFASPTAATGGIERDPAMYPLYHILNTDDLVPRFGALEHLGLCLEFRTDEALRTAAYGWEESGTAAEARERVAPLFSHIVNMPTMLKAMAAFVQVVLEEKTEETLNLLMEKRWSIAPLDKAFLFAGGKARDSLVRIGRQLRVAYRTVMGKRMDENLVAALREEMRPIVATVPLHTLLSALMANMLAPHRLYYPKREVGAYNYIVMRGSRRLHPYIWADNAGAYPARRYTRHYAVFPRETRRVSRGVCPAYRPMRPSPRQRGVTARRTVRR